MMYQPQLVRRENLSVPWIFSRSFTNKIDVHLLAWDTIGVVVSRNYSAIVQYLVTSSLSCQWGGSIDWDRTVTIWRHHDNLRPMGIVPSYLALKCAKKPRQSVWRFSPCRFQFPPINVILVHRTCVTVTLTWLLFGRSEVCEGYGGNGMLDTLCWMVLSFLCLMYLLLYVYEPKSAIFIAQLLHLQDFAITDQPSQCQ